MHKLLPPVEERVRVSVRVPAALAQAVESTIALRSAHDKPEGQSRAAFTTFAIYRLAAAYEERGEKARDWFSRHVNAAAAVDTSRGAVHLQDRISTDATTYVDELCRVLRASSLNRRASRQTVLLAALALEVGHTPADYLTGVQGN